MDMDDDADDDVEMDDDGINEDDADDPFVTNCANRGGRDLSCSPSSSGGVGVVDLLVVVAVDGGLLFILSNPTDLSISSIFLQSIYTRQETQSVKVTTQLNYNTTINFRVTKINVIHSPPPITQHSLNKTYTQTETD